MAGKGIKPSQPRANQPKAKRQRPGGQSPARQAKPGPAKAVRQQVIPEAVANRMVRRIAIATGIPTLMGMGVFVTSYLLVSRDVLDIPPGITLLTSGGCFLLGLLGLSYGVLSASWEPQPGSWFGAEQIGLNLGRIKASLRALRQGGGAGPEGRPGG
ncbi:MAG: PAM68 family protein [Prochlorococcaceae cyanobacterium]